MSYTCICPTPSAERYISPTTPSATTGSVAPPSFPSVYIYIIIAVSAFLLVVGFVVAVCCCACCVHKQKKAKKEGTWTSPNQRNGKTVHVHVVRSLDVYRNLILHVHVHVDDYLFWLLIL